MLIGREKELKQVMNLWKGLQRLGKLTRNFRPALGPTRAQTFNERSKTLSFGKDTHNHGQRRRRGRRLTWL